MSCTTFFAAHACHESLVHMNARQLWCQVLLKPHVEYTLLGRLKYRGVSPSACYCRNPRNSQACVSSKITRLCVQNVCHLA